MKKIYSLPKQILAFILLFSILLLPTSCTKVPTDTVKILDYLSLTDVNGNYIYYGMNFLSLEELFIVVQENPYWYGAHENLSVRFSSSLENEKPTLQLFEVTAGEDNTRPSWALLQNVKIGDDLASVLTAYGKTEAVMQGQTLDLLFAEHPSDNTLMYEITMEEFYKLKKDIPVYRIALIFENGILKEFILGNLDNMV